MMMSFDEFKKAGTDLLGAATTTFQRGVKIAEVTSTKDNDSLPVYALNELVQVCNKQPQEAKPIAEGLLRRVSSSNPVVKYKALKAIRFICQNVSNPTFKRSCGGVNAAPIREAQTWTGVPHPQLGNSLNVRVRDAAKEALEEVFKASSAAAATLPNVAAGGAVGSPALRGRIQGYGSTTGTRIVNSYESGSAGEAAAGAGNRGTAGKYGGFGSEDVRVAEAAGGSWQSAASGIGGGASAAASTPASGARNGARAARATAASTESEAAIVRDLCAPSGGIKPGATPEQLRSFLQRAAPLDAEVLALELTQQLVNESWQARVRALGGIQAAADAVKASGGDHPLAMTVASIASVPETLDSVLTHSHPAVRQAALACAASLGFSAAAGTSDNGGAAPPAGDALGDLLGGVAAPDNGAGGGAMADALFSSTPPAAAAPSAPAPMVDLLGGLDTPPPTAPAAAPVDMFSGLSLSPAGDALAGGSAPPPTDMFAGLTAPPPVDTVAGLTAPPPAADMLAGLMHDAPAPQSASAAPAGDLLGGLTTTAPAPAAAEPPPAVSAVTAMPSGTKIPAMGQPAMPAMPATSASAQSSAFAGQPAGAPGMWTGASGAAAPAAGATAGGGAAAAWPQAQWGAAGYALAGAAQVHPGAALHAATSFGASPKAQGSRSLGSGPSKTKDAFDFVNDAMR